MFASSSSTVYGGEAALPPFATVRVVNSGHVSSQLIDHREGHDVVIASRYQHGSIVRGVPAYRRALSLAASALFRCFFHIRGVKDYTCGFRAYRAATLRLALDQHGAAMFDEEGFQCIADLLLKLRSPVLAVAEVPMVLRYDLKKGASKMNVIRTIRATLALMAKRRMHNLALRHGLY